MIISTAKTQHSKTYITSNISSTELRLLIPRFQYLNPGIKYGTSVDISGRLWEQRAAHEIGYKIQDSTGAVVGIAALYNDLGPEPHLPYDSVAQLDFLAVHAGHSGAAWALYRHIKTQLRNLDVDAILVTRMVSASEFRCRVHKL